MKLQHSQFRVISRQRCRLLTCVASFLITTTFLALTPSIVGQTSDSSRDQAVALWEEAIRAKGGHERLRSIQNLLISSTVDVQAQRSSSTTSTRRLYVMPGKAWIYTHTPDFDVSTNVTVINVERGLCAVTLSPASGGVPPLSLCIPTTSTKFLTEEPVIYLMETNWLRPVPIRARVDGKGNKQVDVVETEVGSLRVDFYLDRKTHLPIQLVTEWYGGITQTGFAGELMTVKLEKYALVDGVVMPRRVTREPRTGMPSGFPILRIDTENADYRFNVNYDPAIFNQPANKKVSGDDWKPKPTSKSAP